MKRFESVAAAAFGLVFLILAFAVAAETAARKLFNVSFQGVDELGGYILALGGALSFAVALGARAHIRIDIIHERFPRGLRVALNVLSSLALATCAGALAWMAWIAWQESVLFRATAQTPWATPLRYPQGIWTGALVLFAALGLVQAMRVLALLVSGRADRVERDYSPRGSKEELQEELDDIRARGAADLTFEAGARS